MAIDGGKRGEKESQRLLFYLIPSITLSLLPGCLCGEGARAVSLAYCFRGNEMRCLRECLPLCQRGSVSFVSYCRSVSLSLSL